LPISGADRCFQFARGQGEQRTLCVGFGDRLRDPLVALEICADRLLTIFGNLIPAQLVDVEAGRAVGEVRAERRTRTGFITVGYTTLSKSRRTQDGAEAG